MSANTIYVGDERQSLIDLISKLWYELRSESLAIVLQQRRWAASAPIQLKVFTALLTDQSELLTEELPHVIEPLLKANEETDKRLKNRAGPALAALTAQVTIDRLCDMWIDSRNVDLAEAIAKGRLVGNSSARIHVFSSLQANNLRELRAIDPSGIAPLLEAASDADHVLAERARQILRQLEKADSQETLGQAVIDHGGGEAGAAFIDGKYESRSPSRTAAILFFTHDWDRFTQTDPQSELLAQEYSTANTQTRKHFAKSARNATKVQFATVVTSGFDPERIALMSRREWDDLLNVLRDRADWPALWRAAQEGVA